MPLMKVRKQVPGRAASGLLLRLFRGEQVDVGGYSVSFGAPIALPEPVVESDRIRWVFRGGIRIDTPGPDSVVTEVIQTESEIQFRVGHWATIILELT